jgi:flagellar hook assembly protein FlgD
VTPNPFNPKVAIAFDVPATGRVELAVYDVRGRLVRQLVDAVLQAGGHRVDWDGKDRFGREAGAGVYFARVESGGALSTAKMVLAR